MTKVVEKLNKIYSNFDNYSEFTEKKGNNLITLRHKIFMQHTLGSESVKQTILQLVN